MANVDTIAPDIIIPKRTVPPEIDRELTVRVYRWALQDAEREIAQDFPLVRTIQNGYAVGFMKYCETVPPQDLPSISMALVKASHLTALDILGETMTDEEIILNTETYRRELEYKEIYTKELNQRYGPDSVYSHKAKVMAQIKKAMRPAFGERYPSKERKFSQ